MEDTNTIPSGDTTHAGSQVDTQTDAGHVSDASTDKVDYRTYEKTLSQKKRRDEENRELRTRLAALEEGKLKEKEQYKELYEASRKELGTLKADLDRRLASEVTQLKKDALKQELFKLGLNPKHEATALRLADIDSLMVDEETKTVIGVVDAAKAFQNDFNEIGLFGRPVASVTQTAPQSAVTTGKPVAEMSKEDVIQRLKELG